MKEIGLGSKVNITNTGAKGEVVATYQMLGGKMQYNVRYGDKDGVMHEFYFFAEQLSLVAE